MKLARYIYKKLGKENVEFVRTYTESLDTLLGITMKDLTEVSYKDVKETIPDLINSDQYERAIQIVLRSSKNSMFLWRIHYICVRSRMLFIFWIQEQYDEINKLEENLASSPSPEQTNAGIHNLNILGDINMIDVLAKGNVERWEHIRNMPYGRIFEKQYRNKLLDDIAKKLETNRKNKR